MTANRLIPFLDLQLQHQSLRNELVAAICSVMDDSAFIGGPSVRSFEMAFAEYLGAENCIGVGNGTDALEIALAALDLPTGEIIVPANTFAATAEAVIRAGHRVVFADIREDNYQLDLDDVKGRIGPDTVGIIAVHLYGEPADMSGLSALCMRYNLSLIEDCAQAHGAEVDGRKVGTFGRVAAFSFYPGKVLGGIGDGGAIVTEDDDLAGRCRMLANHGRSAKWAHELVGRNSRLDAVQAAVLNVKLPFLDDWILARNSVAKGYRRLLSDVEGVSVPADFRTGIHAYHLFVIRTARRDELREFLKANGVETGIHYPVALCDQPAYQYLGQSGKLKATVVARQALSLPIGEHLNSDDVEYVSGLIAAFFSGHRRVQ